MYNVAKHVRATHYQLPVTKQEQLALGIDDRRDAMKFVGELTPDQPHREMLEPTVEDMHQPDYPNNRKEQQQQQQKPKYRCSHQNCTQEFVRLQSLQLHEQGHLGLKPFRCIYPHCEFTSLKRNCVRRHVRTQHFKLPKTYKKQEALNIVDVRNPDDYIAENRDAPATGT